MQKAGIPRIQHSQNILCTVFLHCCKSCAMDIGKLFGRDMIWRQRVTSIILLATFNLLPSLAPFCHKSHYYREICVTANSVLNSFSFWAQTRFLRRPQMEKYISKKIYSTSSAKCPVLLSWSYALAQRLYSYMFS